MKDPSIGANASSKKVSLFTAECQIILISFHKIKDKLQAVSPRKQRTFETKISLQNVI